MENLGVHQFRGKKVDFDRYIYLIRKSNILQQEGSSLIKENKVEFYEELYYSQLLSAQLSYNNRYKYFSIMSNYLKGLIKSSICASLLIELYYEDQDIVLNLKKDFESLLKMEIIEESKIFHSIIGEMLGASLILESQYYPMDARESSFKSEIEKVAFKIAKFID
jgi:hypothetical protein